VCERALRDRGGHRAALAWIDTTPRTRRESTRPR
jgi:hypothetical protein